MKSRIFIALGAFGASFTLGAANAGEWADQCVERLEADGRDTSGCSCLEAEIEANPEMEDEFLDLAEISDPEERYEAASEEAQDAMDSCTR